MLDKINNYHSKRGIVLPQQEQEIISKLLQRRILKKKELFYKANDTNISAAYVVRGCIRVFIKDKQAHEFNRFFAFEDEWVGEFHNILNDTPSKSYAQAVEKTEIIEITKEAYATIIKSCPVFANATLKLQLKSYADILEKEEVKKTMTIEELYTDIMKNRSHVLKRVPLYHIASYLGVKPESLSRVKKKFTA